MSSVIMVRNNGPYHLRYKVVRFSDGNVGVYGFNPRGGWYLVHTFRRHPWQVGGIDMRDVMYYVRRRFR